MVHPPLIQQNIQNKRRGNNFAMNKQTLSKIHARNKRFNKDHFKIIYSFYKYHKKYLKEDFKISNGKDDHIYPTPPLG